MTAEVKRCPSGFWAVFVDGVLWYAAAATRAEAELVAQEVTR